MTEGFADLVAAVQVGTRKAPPPRATEFSVEGAERTVLVELGTLGLMRRAGAVGTSASPFPAAPLETLRIATAAADPLAEALDSAVPAALEWTVRAAERGFVAPHAVLPELLALATKHPSVVPVLGARGRWLAELDDVRLPEGPKPAPEGEFQSLDWNDRLLVLERSPHDEALLQKALADRKREVREAAIERLLRLPNSPQAQELARLAGDAVSVRRSLLRSSLEVMPPDPETLPKWLPRSASRSGLGERALALLDLIGNVPPSLWERPADEMLALAEKTDEKAVLLEAWGRAALRFGDQAWLDALFRHPQLAVGFKERYAARVTEPTFEAVVMPLLRAGNMQAAQGLLLARKPPFSPLLSRETVGVAQRGGLNAYYASEFGMRFDLAVLPLFDNPWGEEGVAENFRARCRPLLDLRRRLYESLQ